MNISKIFRLVSGNILFFCFLLFVLNFISFFIFKSNLIQFFTDDKIKYAGLDRHHLMTNGKSKEYNKLVLEEFYQLETKYKPFVVWTRKEFNGKTTTINLEGDREHSCDNCNYSSSSKIWR